MAAKGLIMKLIVSLCNKKASVEKERGCKMLYPKVFLLEVDTDDETIKPIKVRWWTWGPTGVTGLTKYKDGFLCLLQAKTHRLIYVGRDYKVKKRWKLRKVKDGHSIVVRDGKVYIASTGNDSIVEFCPDTGEERFYWRMNDGEKDTVHINSIIWVKNSMLISAFGKKAGDQWITARNGFLMDITKERVIKEALFHPHTLTTAGKRIYLCESAKKRIISVNEEDMLELDKGYVRGLVITKDEVAVGISHARKRSKSTGRQNKMDDQLIQSFRSGCGIKVFAKKGEKLSNAEFKKFIDLSAYSNEIYDLLLI